MITIQQEDDNMKEVVGNVTGACVGGWEGGG